MTSHPRVARSRSSALRFLLPLVLSVAFIQIAFAQGSKDTKRSSYISTVNSRGGFTLVARGKCAPIVVSSADWPGVERAAKDLQQDIHRVSESLPDLLIDSPPGTKEFVIVGTNGKHPLIEELAKAGKIDLSGLTGKWERYLLQVVEKPFPEVDRVLVITGSDRRGTIYGIYDLCENIGVSPWYWWADVPVEKKENLFIKPGIITTSEPAVQYRGIFINDEAPALSGWAFEKYGGFNSKFYVKVFELILRMKGNYLWPAMWGRAFYDDDSLNPKLADEYGVVIATSHHEPMMRAHDEWRRFGKGPWNYEKNDTVLRDFWEQGIRRMGSYESVVTVGMRGDGDEPMSEEANIALLERIVKDQRWILGEATGKDVTTIPQVWALYKEVQEYYDKGMRVLDDITLLLCDDNWGNIRKLPKLTDAPRKGGYGIYYHFDYVGGPRNYKWLNTNQISRVWEQMHLAKSYGVDRIWIVNVGDIKPMEYPIQFFLNYAWNPDAWPAERLPEYTRRWAGQQFGARFAKEIAEILETYTRFNARRKPELLSPDTYSLINYREAERVVADYQIVVRKARQISNALPAKYRDAFYQLVLHPVLASSNLNDLYVTVGKNRLYAKQGRSSTNAAAERARKLFDEDSLISYYYNHMLAGGKWNHFMDQTHIGYTYWQQPDYNAMPAVKTISIPETYDMGIAIEGSDTWWPSEQSEAVLPELSPFGEPSRFVEVFNRGSHPFEFNCATEKKWIHIMPRRGKVATEQRLAITVDWKNAPLGSDRVPITISGPKGAKVVIYALVSNPDKKKLGPINGFVGSDGCVSMEAAHYTKAIGTGPISWLRILGLGRTLSAMTPIPVTSAVQQPGGESPHLEYRFYLDQSGVVKVRVFLSPTLNFHGSQGLRYGISIDGEEPQIGNIHKQESLRLWEQWVSNNINEQLTTHHLDQPGWHVLKYWMVDPGVVLQKIVIETGTGRTSYLSPPESFHRMP